MTKEDKELCQNVILAMRKQNPKELKTHHCAEFTFTTFWALIVEDDYKGTPEEALQWWNNQRNPNDN